MICSEALDQIDRDLKERLHKSELWREQVILLTPRHRTSRHLQSPGRLTRVG